MDTKLVYKNILVTGGNGFIGTNLILRLIKNHNIICLDNCSSSTRKNLFDSYNNFTFIEADIINFDFDKLPKVDFIFHLACPASPVQYQKDPIKILDTNYIGTKNVLEFALKHNVKVLFTSTSEIYGDPLVSPQVEEYLGNVSTIGPRACYDEGKRVSETLCYEYNKKYNLDITITRLFNTYGPYMEPGDGRVVSSFIKAFMDNKDIEIHGGTQTRSFCYIDDTVNALVGLMGLDNFNIFNVGNPHEITINQLIEVIQSNFKNTPNKQILLNRQNDPMKRKPDITKIKNTINWKPLVNINDGVIKAIEYFKGL